MRYLFVLTFLFSFKAAVIAQSASNIFIDSNANGRLLSDLLAQVETEHNIDFLFEKTALENVTVTGVSGRMYLTSYLDLLLKTKRLNLVKARDNVYFIVNNDTKLRYGTDKESFIILARQNQAEQVLRGLLKDEETGEPLIGAQVLIATTGDGVLADGNGQFQIHVPEGIHLLEIRYVGYEISTYVVGFSRLVGDKQAELTLLPAVVEMQGVTITAEGRDKNVQALLPGVERMGIEEIKKLPTFLGEVDPVKSLTTLPGISTVGELASGINVRGGEAGQNLIVQDGATIYNPTHLFGFFSAFNPDLVSDIALYKGGGPARYGGRVSSVLDIKLKNGDVVKHSVKGSLGLISSRIGIEGPIVRNRSSYIIGGRLSYSNWLLRATNNIQLLNSSAQFYDLTAKVAHTINQNNFLSISGYRSYDDFRLANDSTISWGTTNASLRWDHAFGKHLNATLLFSNSNYRSQIQDDSEGEAFIYQSTIKNLGVDYDLVFKSGERAEHGFGIEAVATMLDPGTLEPLTAQGNVLPEDINDQRVVELAAYWQGDFTLSDKVAVSAGLRYSRFMRFGKDVIYTFDTEDREGRQPSILDTLHYAQGELINSFGGLEPRLSVRYLVNKDFSLKASYYRTYQYLHLISNTTSATPQDYWIASGPYLKPEIGDQVSLGFFKNLDQDNYELSLEGFYKQTANAIDYVDGADITLNNILEAGLVSGEGMSYGAEALIRRNSGKLNGWLAYTYSRSLRRFRSDNQLRSINKGNFYPAPFDQPHNLSVILNYQIGLRAVFTANFSYSTGRPITIPISKFSYDAYLAVLNYSERNEYRIPDYHRLDLSLTVSGKQRKNIRYRDSWAFSVVNVYGRDNAYAIFFSRYGSAKKLSILGNAFPSISYNFSF